MRVYLKAYGNETLGVPVNVEILDQTLRPIEQRWLHAHETAEFPLAPGVYGVRASVSSGRVFEQAVQVAAGEMKDCHLPLHEASPHESHEWAYLTQPIDRLDQQRLDNLGYEGTWLRVWRRDVGSADGWSVVPPPIRDASAIAWEHDGVTYDFENVPLQLHAVQVGGPRVPWKLTALPPARRVMVLVRPAAAPAGRTHPLDVVVCSEDWNVETLLALLQRGDTAQARDWIEKSQLAERLLRDKMLDPAAAAVGGYFLLRLSELGRLHDWANNLANWFSWLPDGPVIHAWQLIIEARRGAGGDRLEVARRRLLEAAARGFPLYTDGLRLLRDGLLLFERGVKGSDKEVGAALAKLGSYHSASDCSMTTTTFTGNHPKKPSTLSRTGTPRGKDPLVYVYDVPLRAAIQHGLLQPGDELIADLPAGHLSCTVGQEGALRLPEGRSFKSLTALTTALGPSAPSTFWDWRIGSTGQPLAEALSALRTPPGA